MEKSEKAKEYLFEDKSFKFLDRNLWKRLGGMLKSHKLKLVGALFCLLFSEFLPQFQPMLVKAIVDGPIARALNPSISPTLHPGSLSYYCTLFIGIVLMGGFLKYSAAVLSQVLALNIIHQLRQDLFKKVQGLKIDFFKRTPVGRLMTRLTNDVDALNSMFAEGFIDLTGAFLMLLFPLAFMFYENWKLALIMVGITPFMFIVTSVFRTKVRDINKIIKRLQAALNTSMQENLSGNHIVQLFGKTREQWNKFDAKNKELKNSWIKNVRYYSFYFPVIHSLTEFSIILLYLAGGYYFLKDQITIGTLLEFSMYMGMFWRPLREISDKYTQLQSALASAERVFTLFDVKAELPSGNFKEFKSPLAFEFHQVDFGYEAQQTVLKKISFSIKEGETLAIVGATGSGKSTILSLCNYFYAPWSGSITLNQRPLHEYDPEVFHRLVSFIPQDVYLFSESIAYNIALSPNIDQKRVEEVSKYVNAHSFISKMEKGYDTVLSVRGENLSTGQRQLLAFARAIYHEPKLLLLDEATSSIDTDTEELIQDALDKVMHDVTSIIIAHRLSTIRSATRILVMHKGEIREEGTHRQLLAKKGIYHKLYQLQSFEG